MGEAEQRLIVAGKLAVPELVYLGNLMDMLVQDENFSVAEKDAMEASKKNLICDYLDNKHDIEKKPAGLDTTETEVNLILRRDLNSVYHILLAETGRYQSDWDFIEPSGALDPSKRKLFPGMQIYLEDIRSPFNVGAMFRAAEFFGVEKIWLSPLCTDPHHKRAERTAMGCVDVLPWERLPESDSLHTLKTSFIEDGNPFLFTMETGGVPLEDFHFPKQGIMIVGSEELGVSPAALAAADSSLGRVSIPAYGAKGSLNVSVAFGIVVQAWATTLCKARFVKHA